MVSLRQSPTPVGGLQCLPYGACVVVGEEGGCVGNSGQAIFVKSDALSELKIGVVCHSRAGGNLGRLLSFPRRREPRACSVIPAQAGIQFPSLDPRLRGNDEQENPACAGMTSVSRGSGVFPW